MLHYNLGPKGIAPNSITHYPLPKAQHVMVLSILNFPSVILQDTLSAAQRRLEHWATRSW